MFANWEVRRVKTLQASGNNFKPEVTLFQHTDRP